MRLKNKICVVTGAATGIGKATAIKLASHGGTVIAADIDISGANETVKEIKKLGLNGMSLKLDLSDMSDIQEFSEKIISEFGRIDVLVNNAGRFSTVPVF